MSNILIQTLKEGYEVLAQQFDFYRLLAQHQAFLVKYKPKGWQDDYSRLEEIKHNVEFCIGFSEGYTIGGYHKPTDGEERDFLRINCINLFKSTEDEQ